MGGALTRVELEWLRCLTVSQRLVPVLPEPVLAALASRGLLLIQAGRPVITAAGRKVLDADCGMPGAMLRPQSVVARSAAMQREAV